MNEKENINWKELIKSYRNSGIGLDRWCDINNVSKSAMNYHLYRKKKHASSTHKVDNPKLMEVNFEECLIQPSITIKLGKLEITVDRQNIDIVSQLLKQLIYD